jgi:hypothetical protein
MAEGGEEKDFDLTPGWFNTLQPSWEYLGVVGDHIIIFG